MAFAVPLHRGHEQWATQTQSSPSWYVRVPGLNRSHSAFLWGVSMSLCSYVGILLLGVCIKVNDDPVMGWRLSRVYSLSLSVCAGWVRVKWVKKKLCLCFPFRNCLLNQCYNQYHHESSLYAIINVMTWWNSIICQTKSSEQTTINNSERPEQVERVGYWSMWSM